VKRTLHVMLKDVISGELEQYQITIDPLEPATDDRRDAIGGQIQEMLDHAGKHPHISGFSFEHCWSGKPANGLVEQPTEESV
jgi:hypothetical protein